MYQGYFFMHTSIYKKKKKGISHETLFNNYYITEYLIEVSVNDQLNKNKNFYKSTKVIKITH